MTLHRVHATMARQDGVITLAQAVDAGMTDAGVSRRVRCGEWRRLSTGVYLRADRTVTAAVSLRAAVYAAGSGAVACGPSAAWWHGLLDRPPRQQWITIPAARAVRRRGSAAAALLLRAAGEGGASEAERMLHRLLRRHGLTGWRPHVLSHGFEIDVAFASERVAIEVDGWAWHRDVERFNSDTQRQNVLVNEGWHVLRFTWHHLRNDPESVLAQIRRALARRS